MISSIVVILVPCVAAAATLFWYHIFGDKFKTPPWKASIYVSVVIYGMLSTVSLLSMAMSLARIAA